MQTLNVFVKTLRDRRYFILGWFAGLMFLGFTMTSFFPSFNGGQIDEMLSSLPPALGGLIGDLQDWHELPNYIASQVFDVRLSIIIAVMAILLATGLTVAEEDKGQLRTVISLPISRRVVVMAKWLAAMLISGLAVLGTVAGVLLGTLVINESLDGMVLVRLGFLAWLMVGGLATIILATGLATGKRGLTTIVALVVAIGGFLLTTFAQAVDWLEPFAPLSFFHYFPAVDIAEGTIELGNVVFYATCIVLALIVTLIFFPRRDIKAN